MAGRDVTTARTQAFDPEEEVRHRPSSAVRPPSVVGVATSATGRFDDPNFSLRMTCLVWIGLWSIGLLMNNVVGPIVSPDQPLDDAFPWPANPIAAVCILVSIALFVVARGKRVAPAASWISRWPTRSCWRSASVS